MLHPIRPRYYTFQRNELVRDDLGSLTRTKRGTLSDIYARIDENIQALGE